MGAVTGPQLVARAQVLADMVGSDFLSTPEWYDLVNDGIAALWADVTAVNKDFRINSKLFTVTTSTAAFTGLSTLSPGFREVRAVRRDPGASTQRYLQRFALRVGSLTDELSYRLQDTNLYIEPAAQSPGNYELLYIPVPYLVAQSDAPSFVITSGTALPNYTFTGIGPGSHTLTEVGNGQLFIDSVPVPLNGIVVVNDEAADTTQNGLYICTQPGSGVAPWKLVRTKGATLGYQTLITSGTIGAGKYYRLTTWTGDDLGPQAYTEQGLDFEIAQFQDYPVIHAAMAAMAKEETPIDQMGALFENAQKRVQRWAAAQRSADPNLIEDVRRGGGFFGGIR